MKRIIEAARIFRIKTAVCINKCDTDPENTNEIESYCMAVNLPLTGRIPFDTDAVKAINRGQTIVDIDCVSGRAVKDVFDRTMKILYSQDQEDAV
jgi:MinD superfamily P-loop ATPase